MRSWCQAAAAESIRQDQLYEAGTWSNDLQEILLQGSANHQHASNSNLTQSKVPELTSYISDGESPDNSPASSDVEDGSPKHNHATRRRSKRSFRDIADSTLTAKSSSSLFVAPRLAHIAKDDDDEEDGESVDHVVPLRDADVNDEFVKAALLEDSKENKMEMFPKLLAKAKSILQAKGSDDESVAVNALLSAFTNDDKTGRPLPRACQELLKQATDEVAAARQRQRESKTHRRSLLQSQVNAIFICSAANCNKRYTTAEGLRLHIRNHHEVDKKWTCHAPDCTTERAFVRQADLRMHLIRMHSPVRPFPCRDPNCNKTFACHSELRRHIGSEHRELVLSLIKEVRESR